VRLILLWTVIGAALGLAAPANPLGLTNDGAQYLSGARNLQATGRFTTSILYFDEHYLTGRLPAPQTVWPPGYPAALAGLGALGLSEEAGTRAIGVASLAAVLGLTFLLGGRLSGSPVAGSLAALWVVGITELLFYVRTPNTDLPFMAFVLGALACVADPTRSSRRRWILAGLFAAASMYVRYAGIFVFAALGVWALLSRWRAGTVRERLEPVWSLVPGGVLIALLMLRNVLLIGDPRGGNSKSVTQPLGGLLRTTFESLVDGLGGTSLSGLRAGGFTTFFAVAGVAALVIGAASVAMGMRHRRLLSDFAPKAALLGLFVLMYTGGVIAISRGTMLTFGLRYLLPVLPCLVLVVVTAGWMGGRAARVAAATTCVLAAIAGTGAFRERLESRIRLAGRPDAALLEWAQARPPGTPLLVIGVSQAEAFQMGGSVLVVPQSFFTARAWDADELRDVVRRYGVRHIIAAKARANTPSYPGLPADVIRGRTPDWLSPAGETPTVRILTVRP
jgi:hypothetical protein